MFEARRGMIEAQRGIFEARRGMFEAQRGMKGAQRGMFEALRGMIAAHTEAETKLNGAVGVAKHVHNRADALLFLPCLTCLSIRSLFSFRVKPRSK